MKGQLCNVKVNGSLSRLQCIKKIDKYKKMRSTRQCIQQKRNLKEGLLIIGHHGGSEGEVEKTRVGEDMKAEEDEEQRCGGVNYERLCLSLQSPFPNEHEFALSLCTILSNGAAAASEKTTKDNLLGDVVGSTPALINLLLAHAGFYQYSGLRLLIEETYREALNVGFVSFWDEVCAKDKRHLLCECFGKKKEVDELEELERGILAGMDGEEGVLRGCTRCSGSLGEDSWSDQLPETLSVYDARIGNRVQRIGEILRNFSYNPRNAVEMARNPTMMRFLIVMAGCNFGSLPQIAFDIICNIVEYLGFGKGSSYACDELSEMIGGLVVVALCQSADRFRIISCLESVMGLTKSQGNRVVLRRLIDKAVYQRIFSLLTLCNDIILTIYCLECLVALSELEEGFCNEIAGTFGSLKTLVAYLTWNATADLSEDFQIKLVDTTIEQTNKKSTPMKKFGVSNWKPGHRGTTRESQAQSTKNNDLMKDHGRFNGLTVPVNGNCITKSPYRNVVIQNNINERPRLLKDNELKRYIIKCAFGCTAVFTGDHKNGVRSHEGIPCRTFTTLRNISPVIVMTQGRNMQCQPDRITLQAAGEKLEEDSQVISSTNSSISDEDAVKENGKNWKLLAKDWDNLVPYLCEWEGCQLRFLEKKQLRWHVYKFHCPKQVNGTKTKLYCKWRKGSLRDRGECLIPRGPFSLVNHLQEFHCSDSALETDLHLRRNKIYRDDITLPKPMLVVEGPRLVLEEYPQFSSAFQEKEEDVTKSVRLTAALILRNVAERSSNARKSLKLYESHLAEIAMSGCECSGVITQLLCNLDVLP